MSNRQVSCQKLINPHFIGVNTFIIFNYFAYVFMYMINLKPNVYILLLGIFHLLFTLLIVSMIRSILGDPGRVPIYWGFFAQQSDNRKRRYCLLCHSFKPQRCHHCSTCQRCVLNMDHHCPWISNCVGYGNRKYFMLFLFYIILTLTFCLGCEMPLAITQLAGIIEGQKTLTSATIVRDIALIIQLIFLIVIITFFKFHVQLVLSNSSTLDNLERQRNPNTGPNIYDMGSYENFLQVFGTNPILWFLPLTPNQYKKGDGVIWSKNQ